MPPSGDPRWAEWSRPLQEFLVTPRSWTDLRQWARANAVSTAMLQQQLAWLSLKRLAATIERGVWQSIDPKALEAEKDVRTALEGETLDEKARSRQSYGEPVGDTGFWTNLARGKY
jgi:hypothetical protein